MEWVPLWLLLVSVTRDMAKVCVVLNCDKCAKSINKNTLITKH
eukprot:SAG31_NODE_8547_length_1432_cov_1.116279_3_plen_42_part_01